MTRTLLATHSLAFVVLSAVVGCSAPADDDSTSQASSEVSSDARRHRDASAPDAAKDAGVADTGTHDSSTHDAGALALVLEPPSVVLHAGGLAQFTLTSTDAKGELSNLSFELGDLPPGVSEEIPVLNFPTTEVKFVLHASSNARSAVASQAFTGDISTSTKTVSSSATLKITVQGR